MTRTRQSRAIASLSLHFGSPISGIGPRFVARKTLQPLQMVYEGQGCQSDECSWPSSDAEPFRISSRSNN